MPHQRFRSHAATGVLLAAGLLLFGGCVQAPQTASSPAAAGVVIMPPDSTDMPPACRAHGGIPAHRSAPPVFAQGLRREARLDSLGLGQLWLRVYATRDGQPVDPLYSLEPYPRAGGLQRVNPWWVRIEEPEGKYLLRLGNLFGEDWQDSVTIRRGFVDSLTVGLGNSWQCAR